MFLKYIFYCLVIFLGINGEKCEIDADCETELAVCHNSICVCPPDFVTNDEYTKCLQVAHNYGDPCTQSLQCSTTLQSGGLCKENVCVCSKGYHYLKGRCWKSAGLGEKCAKTENCYVSNDFESSTCNGSKICECSNGYYQREYSSCRRISLKPGDPCGIDIDCKFENAVCNSNRTCAVNNTFTNNINSEDKLPQTRMFNIKIYGSKVGDNCTKTSDCPLNAECSQSNKCLCLQGFYTIDKSSCHPEVGSPCSTNADCLGRSTLCRDSKYCTCKQGYVISRDARYCDKQSRYLKWSCLRDEECSLFGPNALCIKKRCTCSEKSHWINDQQFCWITKKTGEYCDDDRDCGAINVKCLSNNCTCDPNTHSTSKRDGCRTDSKNVGDVCVESQDCVFPNSDCDLENKKCICKLGYSLNNDQCVSVIKGKCKTDYDCDVTNSKCVKGICACSSNFVPSEDLTDCLPIMTYKGLCLQTSQCSHLDALCDDGYCLCKENWQYQEGWKCYEKRAIGQYCNRTGQCPMRHAECRKHTCVCKHGYRPTYNHTYCISDACALKFNIILIIIFSLVLSYFA